MGIFVAEPEGPGPHPSLIVIQEAFGVNDQIKSVTQRFAEQGYIAASPDLFHRFEQKLVSYDDMETAINTILKLSDDMVMADIDATLAHLKRQSNVKTDRIGVIGFCFGGRTAYLVATRSKEVAAAVGFYGAGIADPHNPDAPITHSQDIQAPILLFFGAEDRMVPPHHITRIDETLTQLGKEHQIKTYPGAGHAFFREGGPSFNKEAADDAWSITLGFLRRHLA